MVAGVESGVVAADAVLARGLTTPERLGHWLDRLTRHPGVGDARLAVELADPRAASPGESRSRLVLTALDLGALIAEKRRADRLRALGYAVVRITWADLACPAQLRRRLLAGRSMRRRSAPRPTGRR